MNIIIILIFVNYSRILQNDVEVKERYISVSVVLVTGQCHNSESVRANTSGAQDRAVPQLPASNVLLRVLSTQQSYKG